MRRPDLAAPRCSADGGPPASGRAPGPVRLLACRALRTLTRHCPLINKRPAQHAASCLPVPATAARLRRPRPWLHRGSWAPRRCVGARPAGICRTAASAAQRAWPHVWTPAHRHCVATAACLQRPASPPARPCSEARGSCKPARCPGAASVLSRPGPRLPWLLRREEHREPGKAPRGGGRGSAVSTQPAGPSDSPSPAPGHQGIGIRRGVWCPWVGVWPPREELPLSAPSLSRQGPCAHFRSTLPPGL